MLILIVGFGVSLHFYKQEKRSKESLKGDLTGSSNPSFVPDGSMEKTGRDDDEDSYSEQGICSGFYFHYTLIC